MLSEEPSSSLLWMSSTMLATDTCPQQVHGSRVGVLSEEPSSSLLWMSSTMLATDTCPQQGGGSGFRSMRNMKPIPNP